MHLQTAASTGTFQIVSRSGKVIRGFCRTAVSSHEHRLERHRQRFLICSTFSKPFAKVKAARPTRPTAELFLPILPSFKPPRGTNPLLGSPDPTGPLLIVVRFIEHRRSLPVVEDGKEAFAAPTTWEVTDRGVSDSSTWKAGPRSPNVPRGPVEERCQAASSFYDQISRNSSCRSYSGP